MPNKPFSLFDYWYIWKFKAPEKQYTQYILQNDRISFRLFTISNIIISVGFLIVDFNRPVDYYWVFVFRFGLVIFYASLLLFSQLRKPLSDGLQLTLMVQIVVSYGFYFSLEALAKMPFFFLPNVLPLFFYTVFAVSGLRFRYAFVINMAAFIVFAVITKIEGNEYYVSQYPNLVSNLIISIICGGFIEKQKRKDFLQFSELVRQKEELDELNQQKNRVISILSHDVAAPLQSINGLLTTYEKNQISKEELDRFLPEVRTRVDKVSFLVYSLVRWAKSQLKGFRVQRVVVDLEPLLKENVALVNPFVKEKSISVHLDCPPGLQVLADHEMVNLIIRNLVSNVVKFTPKEKRIFLKAFRSQTMVILEVSNEGDPIPEDVRKKLFTLKTKSGLGTANESGTGLGLAISQQFAVLNGGRISLEERTGSVNTFRVELPSAQ